MAYSKFLNSFTSLHMRPCLPQSPFSQKQKVLQPRFSTMKKNPSPLHKISPTSLTTWSKTQKNESTPSPSRNPPAKLTGWTFWRLWGRKWVQIKMRSTGPWLEEYNQMGRRPSCQYGISRERGIQMGGSSNKNPACVAVEACLNGG